MTYPTGIRVGFVAGALAALLWWWLFWRDPGDPL